ncbi:SIS domain-containing protein [Nonomuraea sp. NPDC049625]|uniref:D-sedoheptulose-7-phosphate isomerase n=1 Tax=Nonomuraea sp. NPDC049625 TaxID=3155775 RepID=UPI00343FD216
MTQRSLIGEYAKIEPLEDSSPSPTFWRAAALRKAVDDAEAQESEIDRTAVAIARRLRSRGIVLTAGNGGSAAQAQHFAAELVGRLSSGRERGPLAARALAADVATLTALANDYGYAQVFSRQLRAVARPDDVLVLFSTSGRSENLLRAAETARGLGVYTVALLGAGPSPLAECDASFRTGATDPGTVQEFHLLLVHALTEAIEEELASGTDIKPIRGER